MIGSFSSCNSTTSRRLAASARANSARPAVSASLGRSVVSAHDTHSRPGRLMGTNQLHSARWRLAHSSYSAALTKPERSASSPVVSTSSAISSSENPSGLPQARHAEFSNVRRWPQFGQWKSRIQFVTFVGHHVDCDVDLALLGIGVDDAAQRRHVGIVATPPDDDVALVDHLVVGGIKTQPLELAGRLWRPHRGPGMRGVDTDHAILSRRWVGGQVAGHVAGRQTIGAQAGDRQSREVLAYPLPGRQNLIDAGRHRGRPRAIGEVGVNPRREVTQHLAKWSLRDKARRGVVANLIGDLGWIQVESELGGQSAAPAPWPGRPPRAPGVTDTPRRPTRW